MTDTISSREWNSENTYTYMGVYTKRRDVKVKPQYAIENKFSQLTSFSLNGPQVLKGDLMKYAFQAVVN